MKHNGQVKRLSVLFQRQRFKKGKHSAALFRRLFGLKLSVLLLFLWPTGRVPQLRHPDWREPGRGAEVRGRQRGQRGHLRRSVRLHHLQLCGQPLWISLYG